MSVQSPLQKVRKPTSDTEFIFVRHAESMANANPDDPSAQVADPILTELGLKQAAQLSERIASSDVKAIYTSNTSRARATAQPIEEKLNIGRVELPQIDEWNLGKTGQVDELKFREMLERWCMGNLDTNLGSAPESESLRDLNARVVPAFEFIFEQHRKDGGVVLIVSHGGAISWTMPTFASNVSMQFAVQNYLGNCSFVSVTDVDGHPHVVRWADQRFS